MPRRWKRTTEKAKWNVENLNSANEAVKNGMSIRMAAKRYTIPFSTLQQRLKQDRANEGPKLGRKSIFTAEQEQLMTDHIKFMAKIFYGLTPLKIRSLAFEFATKNKIKNNFNQKTTLAGKDWLDGFLRRNPSLSTRKPEATSINRVTAFNKVEVNSFFSNLEKLMDEYKFSASKIFNMDETGVSTVQDPGKIIAQKGQRRVGSVTSWERGKLVTVICAFSAAGNYIPPMFIFARKRMSPLLCKDGPADAIYTVSKNGWSNTEIFTEWLRHFCVFAKPSKEQPVLLILDNHGSHVSLETFELCRTNGIIMLSIPPHTSHRLQPLDIAFYGPLKSAYKRQCDLMMKSYALTKITPYDIASIFNRAYCDVAKISNAVSGFRTCGIHPMNPDVFTDEDYAAANTFQLNTEPQEIVAVTETNITTAQQQPSSEKENTRPEDAPVALTNTNDNNLENLSSTQQIISIQDLAPIPTTSLRKSTRKSIPKQRSEILTSSPFKQILLSKAEKRKQKELKLNDTKNKKGKQHIKKRKLTAVKSKRQKQQDSSDSSDESSIPENIPEDTDDSACSGEESCVLCGEFGKNELWYRCTICGNWVHAECSGVNTPKGYKCDSCVRKLTKRQLRL